MNAINSSGPDSFKSSDAFQKMLSGHIEPVRVALPYQIGLIVVACAMIMLPVLYVGLIAATGYAVYSHALSPEWITGNVTSGRVSFSLYLGPIIMGVIMVVFMLKPLFSRASLEREALSLTAENEPGLYNFVSNLCRFVGAPVPREIEVGLDVNASAGFRGGMLSMFRANDLSLHIGLPLAAGINLNQLTGVLAHEFGHFSQGTAMRMTYVIRSINAWFARVVFERDGLDDALEEHSKNQGVLLMAILMGARAMVFTARQLLKALMYTGGAISCYMMRQMEYDADLYGVRVVGNTEYDKLPERIMYLSMAADKMSADLNRVFLEGRLVDDIPGLIAANECRMPDDVRLRYKEHIASEESGLLNTHPSPSERLANTNEERCDGAINLNMPATVLFRDFEELCRLASHEHYKVCIEPDPSELELISVAEL
ncbi:MAG: M48 family metalloprotease, partial [Candidatus Latescibacteria bacterium]|nr:M48 family metalloprotease [Candidatus Latescibacterota bacterium]